MPTKISHARFKVQIEKKPPPELIETYINGNTPGGVSPRGGFMKSPDKAYKQLKKVIPDVEAVIEKIIKPRIKGHQAFLRADAVTRRGTKVKDSLKPTRAELVRQAKLWLKKTKHAFRHKGKEYVKIMKVMSGLWGETMTWFVLPFRGFGDKIRGVGPIAAQWLTGILTVLKKINRKEIIKGGPIDITQPGPAEGEARPYGRQGGKFRNRFNSLILSVGKPIIVNKYQSSDIIYANEHINQLINDYARDEFVSFTPGGESHVDFMMADGELFLDVQVSVK